MKGRWISWGEVRGDYRVSAVNVACSMLTFILPLIFLPYIFFALQD